MAERDKEETKLKVIETLTLCVRASSSSTTNSSLIQSPNTSDSIIEIHHDLSHDEEKSKKHDLTFSTEQIRSSSIKSVKTSEPIVKIKRDDLIHGNDKIDEKPKKIVHREINRCSGCKKKVRLTGFRCRCGELFCPEHRYSDRHDCSYDYKSHGREAIARENPIVRPAKIVKI